jgi:hypothetical protein
MIILSDNSGITAKGHAGDAANPGVNFSQSLCSPIPSVPTGLDQSVHGGATWTVTQPVSGATLPLKFEVKSHAALKSTLTKSAISATGHAAADSGPNVGPPFAGANASAASVFDVKFRLATAHAWQLDLNHAATRGNGAIPAAPTFSLSKAGGAEIIGAQNLVSGGPGMWTYHGTVLLARGTYQLVYSGSAAVTGDPLGDFEKADFSLTFHW